MKIDKRTSISIVLLLVLSLTQGCVNTGPQDTTKTPEPTSQPTETSEVIVHPPPYYNLSKDIRDKIGGEVQFLWSLREMEKPYLKGADYYKEDSEDARLYRYLAGDYAEFGVIFDHELSEGEVTNIEGSTGAEFIRGNDGTSYHVDLIYDVDVPWDKLDEFANVSSIVKMDSGFTTYAIPGG